jgi:peptide chain release factor 1
MCAMHVRQGRDVMIVEIRAGEGGRDAEDLVVEQFRIYSRLAAGRGLAVEILQVRAGVAVFRVDGAAAAEAFRDEAGGHRWQRVPDSEKHGRVHSSTVTVAVLPEPTATEVVVHPGDLEWSFSRGSGPGGQNKNKLETAVDLVHRPTGVRVHCESERSQHENKRIALAALRARLWQAQQEADTRARADLRRGQVGSAERSEKRRTVAVQRGQVVDHVTGRRWDIKAYLAGRW